MIDEKLLVFERIGKQIISSGKYHHSQFLFINKDGQAEIMIANFRNEFEKDETLMLVRKKVFTDGIEEYYMMNESWLSRDVNCGRASFDPKRKEAFVVSMFRKDMRNMTIVNVFERDGDKVVWTDRSCNDGADSVTMWNVYLEWGSWAEKFDNIKKQINEADKK